MDNFDLKAFLISLQGTIEWCTTRCDLNDPEFGLRSTQIYPDPFQISFQGKHAYTYIVESVARKRKYGLGYSWKEEINPANSLLGGRLLAYEPDVNLSDGAAVPVSKGFLDELNVPGWDTWVAFIQDRRDEYPSDGYLVSWIPAELTNLVSNGIYVNPEGCIWWLDTEENHLAKLLKTEGLL